MTDRGAEHFEYDERGRISSVGGFHYVYNGFGERVVKRGPLDMGTDGTYFAYDLSGHLISESQVVAGLAIPQKSYVWADDRLVAVYSHAGTYAGQWLDVHTDHLGTPRAITLRTGSRPVVWRWSITTDIFGGDTPEADPDGDGTQFTFNLRFDGQYFDLETRLHYNYLRTYEPLSARYIEADPIGLAGGSNRYAYAGANPLRWSDPLGLAKGGRHNIGTEGFTTKSDAKDVLAALNEAIRNKQAKRILALKGLLKVIKRGGTMGLVDFTDIFSDLCLKGGQLACQTVCIISPEECPNEYSKLEEDEENGADGNACPATTRH